MKTQEPEVTEIVVSTVLNAQNMEISSNVQTFVDAFIAQGRRTALAIVDMAYIVYSAKNELAPKYYEQFKAQIHFDKNSTSFAKLEKIGEHAALLKLHADHLPNSWTTLYHLSRLTDESFEGMVGEGKIWEGMTGAEAIKLVSPETKPKAKTMVESEPELPVNTEKELTVKFDVVPQTGALIKLHAEIIKLIANAKIEASVVASPNIEAILFAESEVA